MVVIKNVAVTGAAGSLGKPIVQALINSGKFNITVLARESSKATFPASVKVAHVDFDSVEALTTVLRGQDAVVSAIGMTGLQSQTVVIDAAIAAGVKRYLPSEYGSDLDNPKTKALPLFGHKVAITNYLEQKAASHPDFTYTLVRNSAFLDWGLNLGFILNWKTGKQRVFDGGDQLYSSTTLDSVALAVVGVLTHFEETKNRAVYIEDIRTSQNKIIEIAKKIAPEKEWELTPANLADVKKAADERLAKGDLDALFEYVYVATYAEGYGGLFKKLDNELLGVPGNKTDADIEAILKPLLAGGK